MSKSHTEQMEADELSKVLAQNGSSFEARGINVFGDRAMLERVYHDLLQAFAGEGELNAEAIATEFDESQTKVDLSIKVLKSILGLPDLPPGGGEAAIMPVPEEPEEQEEPKIRLAG